MAFVIEPTLRFAGQPGEPWAMCLRDPSGNPIGTKGFTSPEAIFDAD